MTVSERVYVQIDCSDVLSFFKFIKSMKPRDWAFRGHAKFAEGEVGDWKLESTLSRFLRTHQRKINAATSV